MSGEMGRGQFKPGDWVIYRKQKVSTSPGPRAKQTSPAPKGETYSYIVEKYWTVKDVLGEGQICLSTRRGKQHNVAQDDPHLRKANWWERWLFRARFPSVEESKQKDAGD